MIWKSWLGTINAVLFIFGFIWLTGVTIDHCDIIKQIQLA